MRLSVLPLTCPFAPLPQGSLGTSLSRALCWALQPQPRLCGVLSSNLRGLRGLLLLPVPSEDLGLRGHGQPARCPGGRG